MHFVVPEVYQSVSIFTIIVLGKVKFNEGLCFQFLWKKRKNLLLKLYNNACATNTTTNGSSYRDQFPAVTWGKLYRCAF